MENKANVIMHPIRMRILLNLANRQLTSKDLSKLLDDVPPATLYRHIKALYEAELLQVVEERPARGATEKVYAQAPGAAALSPEDLAKATPEEHMRYFTVFVSSLLADFSRYIEGKDANPLVDGVGYRQVSLNLSDEELTTLVQQINGLIVPLLSQKLESNRRRRSLTTILIPDDHRPPDTDGDSGQ
jgi:DNA-binding transcriptional ArsR family regulator